MNWLKNGASRVYSHWSAGRHAPFAKIHCGCYDNNVVWLFHIWATLLLWLIPEICESTYPDSKVHWDNMRPIWGRQDPGGPHVGPMSLAILYISITVGLCVVKWISYLCWIHMMYFLLVFIAYKPLSSNIRYHMYITCMSINACCIFCSIYIMKFMLFYCYFICAKLVHV